MLHRFLMPDDYVQDPYSTLSYNRYSYVLNNPLMYVDPSGEQYTREGKERPNQEPITFTPEQQRNISDIIEGWLDEITSAQYGRWFKGAIGKPVEKWVNKHIVNPIKNLFGGRSQRAPAPVVHMLDVPGNMSAAVPTNLSIFGPTGGGMGTGANGIGGASGPLDGLIYKTLAFQTGFRQGFFAGATSTLDFIKSLGTAAGWQSLGQGFMDLAALGSTVPTAEGIMLRAQLGQSIDNYVTNIPNMSAYEIGHDLGFASEKVAEIYVTQGVSSGAGIGVGSIRVLSNTTLRGATIFKTGKNFRIDIDIRNGLHYHRRGPGGIGRHRPWQVKPGDKGGFWKRF